MRQDLETGPRVGHMFLVDNFYLPPIAYVSVVAMVSSITSLSLWHAWLSHVSSSRVKHLAFRGLLGSASKENFDCVSCQLGKQPVLPFNNSESVSTSISGSQYFVVYVDDYSRYSWIFHMKNCSELLQIYCNFAKIVETQLCKCIKIVWSNNALEYT